MRRNALSTCLFSFLVVLAACGTGGSSGDDVDAANAIDAAPPDAGGPPPGFTKLIGRTWSLTSGQTDTYKCVRVQVPTDMYVGAFYAQAPLGTHHTVLTQSTNATKLGEYDCNAGALDYQMLFASGVGTPEFDFPDGIGMKLNAGSYINLNLHLFDATDHALADETDIYVKELTTAPDAAHTAEMIFAGTGKIDELPMADIKQTFSGGCTLPASPAEENLIALWPHMHQTAVHQLVTLTPSGSSTPMTLLDKDYSFSEQKTYPWATPVVAHGGDTLWTTCTFVNNTNPLREITFGESSLDEMCFTGIYRYPATGTFLFGCVTDLTGL